MHSKQQSQTNFLFRIIYGCLFFSSLSRIFFSFKNKFSLLVSNRMLNNVALKKCMNWWSKMLVQVENMWLHKQSGSSMWIASRMVVASTYSICCVSFLYNFWFQLETVVSFFWNFNSFLLGFLINFSSELCTDHGIFSQFRRCYM